MIESSSGVVWRTTRKSHIEVLVVHRRRQKDWSLPKGRLRRTESALECALREVREETGLDCIVDAVLPPTTYTDRHGRSRVVHYWVMQARAGEFRPNDEVDRVRWTRLDRLREVLTHGHDLLAVDALRQDRIGATRSDARGELVA